MPLSVFLLVVLSALAGLVLIFAAIAFRRWVWARRKPVSAVNRCRCGYELDQLDTIRCPECGRVRRFDATAEDLGLTPDQLHLAKAKRDARLQAEAQLPNRPAN